MIYSHNHTLSYPTGASKNSIDLLPSPGVGTEWTKSLPTDEGRESDEIFEFDGANTAVAIPNDVLDHNLSSVFTISAWLKHKHIPTQEKHVKEHVFCSADDHSECSSFDFLMIVKWNSLKRKLLLKDIYRNEKLGASV